MGKWLLIVCLVSTAFAAAEEPWTWKDSKGVVRSEAELDNILNMHKDWVRSAGQKGARGNLAHADLRKASLAEADMRGMDLTGAVLEDADLTEAKLSSLDFAPKDSSSPRTVLKEADLHNADLTAADLSGADLRRAKFTGTAFLSGYGKQMHPDCDQDPLRHAHCWKNPLCGKNVLKQALDGAQLCGADLDSAELVGADLTQADLTAATLVSTVMTEAQLERANLEGAWYEPYASPSPSSMGLAWNLAELKFGADPEPLVALRTVLQAGGFEQPAREVNTSYHRHGENLLQLLLFDWTCAWGAQPLRPLLIVAVLSVLCTLVYLIVMHFNLKGTGLYLTGGSSGQGANAAKETVLRVGTRWGWFGPVVDEEDPMGTEDSPAGQPPKTGHGVWWWVGSELVALRIALLFSLMSVFTIGVEGLDGRRWMRMMQPLDFDIEARGWVRTVSGVQALLGSGLLALALLSYFGHPFW